MKYLLLLGLLAGCGINIEKKQSFIKYYEIGKCYENHLYVLKLIDVYPDENGNPTIFTVDSLKNKSTWRIKDSSNWTFKLLEINNYRLVECPQGE